jgi:hypothetical protein
MHFREAVAETDPAKKIRALRNQGRYETDDWFERCELAQMKRIESILTARETVARA